MLLDIEMSATLLLAKIEVVTVYRGAVVFRCYREVMRQR
jgi:hypothetical protein